MTTTIFSDLEIILYRNCNFRQAKTWTTVSSLLGLKPCRSWLVVMKTSMQVNTAVSSSERLVGPPISSTCSLIGIEGDYEKWKLKFVDGLSSMFDGKVEKEPCQGGCACSCSKTEGQREASESVDTAEKGEPLFESESEDEEESVAQNGTCGTNGDSLLDLEDLGSVVQNLHEAKVQWSTSVHGKHTACTRVHVFFCQVNREQEEIAFRKKNKFEPREMLTPSLRKALQKQGYKLIGSHSGVKLCRWTKVRGAAQV